MSNKVRVLVEIDKRDYDVYIRQPIGTLQVALSRGIVITDDCISRSALEKEIFRHGGYDAYEDLWDAVRKAINNAPTYGKESDK